jgi:hypothetical protein
VTESPEFKKLYRLSRLSKLPGAVNSSDSVAANITPLCERLLARTNHFYRIPFAAANLCTLLHEAGITDAVPAGPSTVVSRSVFNCVADCAEELGGGLRPLKEEGDPSPVVDIWYFIFKRVLSVTGVVVNKRAVEGVLREKGFFEKEDKFPRFGFHDYLR